MAKLKVGYGVVMLAKKVIIPSAPEFPTSSQNSNNQNVDNYAQEGKYTGIYSLLQMFVIMTPDSTAYFANAKPDHFNKAFLFNWRTRDNHPVENGLAFTRQVLNIPMAHKISVILLIIIF